MELTHINEQGRARMVDVSEKEATVREATAMCRIRMNEATLARLREGSLPKGDVLSVAQVAGIMAAKRTPDAIPMCHPLPLTGADIRFTVEENGVLIHATVRCKGLTGVEMEALHAAAVAALTIYDMCKAVQKDMEIYDLMLLEKSGGKSGNYRRETAE
ncbi:MAG: cyclic pyranopterin monophosphate synthase MoaC [Clostridia bacterium]|nr:cyclic pyranopterin monophosphate synthase MoaC [Clostridia bacterium]